MQRDKPAIREQSWFPHDTRAANDPRIIHLIRRYGLGGYGAYWRIVELLRGQPEYRWPDLDLDDLAAGIGSTAAVIGPILEAMVASGLFQLSDNRVLSCAALARRMSDLDQIRFARSEAGRRGAAARWADQAGNGKSPI